MHVFSCHFRPAPTVLRHAVSWTAGVYSHIENMQPLIGATCEALGIVNNSHAAYQLARNKLETRKVCGAAGLATTKV